MNQIMDIRNFNAYVGRYSRKPNARHPQHRVGWYVEDLFYTRVPVLAIRNLYDDDKNWPLVWRRGKNLDLAIKVTLDTIKSWQAFRPMPSNNIIGQLEKALPSIALSFQENMKREGIDGISGLKYMNKKKVQGVISSMATAVERVSRFKNGANPMMGSKIMHFLFPEFFPVWDTQWIKLRCLNNESDYDSDYSNARDEYTAYVNLMIGAFKSRSCDLFALEKAFIRNCKLNNNEYCWDFFWDITPLLFEICLLGKHLKK